MNTSTDEYQEYSPPSHYADVRTRVRVRSGKDSLILTTLTQLGGKYRSPPLVVDPREEAAVDFAREVAECRAEPYPSPF
jgi:hypothetical protein